MDFFDYTMKVSKCDRKEHLDGYIPATYETAQKVPSKFAAAENTYGKIVVGKNRINEKVLILLQTRQKEKSSIETERKEFTEQTKTVLPKRQSNCFVNSRNKNESALEYRNNRDNAGHAIARSLMGAFEKNELDIQSGVMPFTTVKSDKNMLEQLHLKRQMSDRKGKLLDKEIDRLSSTIVQKEQHMNRFKKQMDYLARELMEEKIYDRADRSLLDLFILAAPENDDDKDDNSQDDELSKNKVRNKTKKLKKRTK